ncbi:MFS transporter small subunit [Caballeronia sp. LjRoot29]|uniref:MFS transporter small subunit n=1 Tax=Caballeronia sp. LjRoot29 TaxID=3342315 RepID=UPI003F4F741D
MNPLNLLKRAENAMNTNTNLNRELDAHPTNKLLLGVFWIYAIVPLAWGVINTLVQASKLFQ